MANAPERVVFAWARPGRLLLTLASRSGPIGLALLIVGVFVCFLAGVFIGLLFAVPTAQRGRLISPMFGSLVAGGVLVASGIATLRAAGIRRLLQARTRPLSANPRAARAWIPVISLGYLGGIVLLAYFGVTVGGQRGFELGSGSFLLAFTIGSLASIQYQQANKPDIHFMFGWSAARARGVLGTLGLAVALGDLALALSHG